MIKKKIIKAHIKGLKVYFTNDEIKEMNKLFTTSPTNETRSLIALLIKSETNIPKAKIEFWRDYVSFCLKDVNRTFVTKNPILNVAKVLNKTTREFEGGHLSFEQEDAFNKLIDSQNKIVNLVSGASSGKTWISWLAVKHLAKTLDKFCVLHITTNESLEEQLVSRYKYNSDGISVSNKINSASKKYIIGTPEKIFGIIDQLEEKGIFPHIIVVDEAHVASGEEAKNKFYKFIINQCLSRFNSRMWLLSPSLNSPEVLFDSTQQITSADIKAFESNKLFMIHQNGKYTFLDSEKKDFDFTQKEHKAIGFSLHYVSPKYKIFKKAKFHEQTINAKQEAKISKILNDEPQYYKFKTYYATTLLTKGIGVYHSSMPQVVKSWLFKLAEQNLLTDIFATNAIANGVDFSFDNIVLHTLSGGTQSKEMMNLEFFKNLIGRSGRYNMEDGLFKKSIITFLEPTKSELTWINKNRDNFYGSNVETKTTTPDKVIDANLKKFNSLITKNEWEADFYKLDPRINKNITEKMISDNFKTLNKTLSNIFDYVNKNGDLPNLYEEPEEGKVAAIKSEIIDIFSALNKLYKPQTSISINDNPKKHEYKKIFANTLKSFYYNNEDDVYYGWWYWVNKCNKKSFTQWGWIPKDAKNYEISFAKNKKFEEFIKLYKTNVKYKMSVILNHAIKVNNKACEKKSGQKFLPLETIKRYKISDLDLFNALKKQGALSSIEELVNTDLFQKIFFKKLISVSTYQTIFNDIQDFIKSSKHIRKADRNKILEELRRITQILNVYYKNQ